MIKNGSTRIRNAGIAEVFGRMYVIEGWGTGIKRMIESCREYGLPDPAFTELGTNFRVEFFRKKVSDVGVKLSATQKKIVNAMEHNPQITNVKFAEKLGVTTRTIERNISTLKKENIIERIGSDKDGYWKVDKQN